MTAVSSFDSMIEIRPRLPSCKQTVLHQEGLSAVPDLEEGSSSCRTYL